MTKDCAQGARDHEVLLDLEIINPRRMRSPLGDLVTWDHTSGSTSALTMSLAGARCPRLQPR